MIKGRKIAISTTGITAWVALVLQLYILIHNTRGNGMTPLQALGRFLIFFTVLTNLLVAISCTITILSPGSAAGKFFTKQTVTAAIAVYIFIVGLVYNLVLRSLWRPEGMQKIADELLHVIVPLLFVAYWMIFAAKSSLRWRDAFTWLSFPAAYLIYAMLRGSTGGFYPYPFLDANKLSPGQIMLNCAGLMFAFVVVGLLFIWIARFLPRPKAS